MSSRDHESKHEKSMVGPHSDVDIVVEDAGTIYDAELAETKELKQGLRQRHIQMIALAGAIGTGLFLGSGRAIGRSGPLGAWLAYTIVGLACWPLVMVIAEMGALVPLSGGIVRYAEYFVDPALSFANGWNLVYSYLVSIPAELTAAAVLVSFWSEVNGAVWITVFGLIMIACSASLVSVYGELEFFFCTLKIMLIIGINIMALVITCGGGPTGESIGFRYWRDPGPFVQYLDIPGSLGQFLGFFTSLNNAIYSYSGLEVISVAAAETKNPRTAIPSAARRVFWRIALFYILTIFMVGLVVPSNAKGILSSSGTASTSPFVVAATTAGIKVVPSIINAIVLTSAWSSGNSNMLSGSRVLYGMAKHGHAPKIFLRLNRFGVPYVAIALFSLFMCLGYMTLSNTASTVFGWLQDLVSVTTVVNWIIITLTYLRFYYGCKAQGIDRKTSLPYAAPFQPYTTWAALVLFVILLTFGGFKTFIHGYWSDETFVSSYINVPLVLLLYFGYKLWHKTKIVPLSEIPIKPFIQAYQSEEPEIVKPKTGLRKLNVLWS
ncbi:hypothetical protein K461DRAFT_281578 [Myriangium duriaei CBS 260.36]|uniref:Amino acid permease/ SLC12A domain-containing protein n=1 Tax=Myriangium duriaei CBS 260.36 TaxID=1168546 RepID=A0A9P4ISJ4_9PEZI|nr:hypothetical protein K461DRAFT_281578 [Myriangium duriaei CBS 260.36]